MWMLPGRGPEQEPSPPLAAAGLLLLLAAAGLLEAGKRKRCFELVKLQYPKVGTIAASCCCGATCGCNEELMVGVGYMTIYYNTIESRLIIFLLRIYGLTSSIFLYRIKGLENPISDLVFFAFRLQCIHSNISTPI
jgi:hypothetical protein